MFGRKKYRSRELTDLRRKKLKRLLIIGSSTVLLFIAFASLIPRLDAFVIKDIGIAGNNIESSDVLSSYVENKLRGNYLFIIPKNNWIFYPKRSLEEDLLRDFKRLQAVEVTYEGNNSLLIDIKERKPDWIWCNDKQCYFIDNYGLIFAKAPNFSGPVFFKTSGGLSENIENPIGEHFTAWWTIDDMKKFIDAVEKLGLNPISLDVLVDGDTNIHLKEGFILKISKTKALDTSLKDLRDTTASGVLSEKKINEYIDLRFDNKIFYK